jgi:hypothetical protein
MFVQERTRIYRLGLDPATEQEQEAAAFDFWWGLTEQQQRQVCAAVGCDFNTFDNPHMIPAESDAVWEFLTNPD